MVDEATFYRTECEQFVKQLREIAAGTHIDAPSAVLGVQRMLAYHLNREAEFKAARATEDPAE